MEATNLLDAIPYIKDEPKLEIKEELRYMTFIDHILLSRFFP